VRLAALPAGKVVIFVAARIVEREVDEPEAEIVLRDRRSAALARRAAGRRAVDRMFFLFPHGTRHSTRGMGKQRFQKPELRPQVTTLWEYPSQHYGSEEQGSKTYKGATPSFVIWNVVHRFSQEGEIVIDPFCGSGTTLDVCRDLKRIALGFDVAPAR